MAGYTAIAAAAKSLERVLSRRFLDDEPVDTQATKAVLVSSDDFILTGDLSVIKRPSLSIFLVKVEVNPVMRAPWAAVGADDGRSHVPLDLHFLLTPWGANAEHEHRILGSAIRCLDESPVLSGPLLDTTHEAGFGPDEALQVIPGDMGPDGIMRIWDTLDADYRLSVPYIVRIVRIDSEVPAQAPPVLTSITGATPGLDP